MIDVIEVKGLTKVFGDVTALGGVDFTIPQGSTTALLGANGAGKTTTIAILLGLLIPTSGAVSVFGEDMVKNRHRVLGRMNFSSPYSDLPRRLKVWENLTVYGNLYGLDRIKERIAKIAGDLGMEDLLDRSSGHLSAGQKTRVSLAKALLNEPELLLLDEPTASLDPDTGDWMRGYLETWRARTGATIVLASHNMAEVERLANHVLMMRDGAIVDRGGPGELIARYGRTNMEEVFLHIARNGELEAAP